MGFLRYLASAWKILVGMGLLYLFRGNRIATIANIILCGFAVLILIGKWRATRFIARFFFATLGPDSQAMRKLRESTAAVFFLPNVLYSSTDLLLLGLPSLLAWFVWGYPWYGVFAAILGRQISMGLHQLDPPLAIYLAASDQTQVDLCNDLTKWADPLKIVNLLNVESSRKSGADWTTARSSRLDPEVAWRGPVETLLASVPIVILDIRSGSPALGAEIALIGQHQMFWKVLIVHSGTCGEQFLPWDNPAAQEQVAFVRADELVKTVIHSIIMQKRLPTPEDPIHRFAVPPASFGQTDVFSWPGAIDLTPPEQG